MTILTAHRPRLVLAGASLALAIVALPSVTLAQSGPEEPVRGLFQAIAEKRFEDAGSFFCPEFADQAAQMDLGAALAGNLPANVDPQVAEDAIVFGITGPDGTGDPVLTVGPEDPAGTPVDVDALLTAGLDPEGSEGLIRAVAEAQLEALGGEYSEEDVAAMMTLLQGRLGGMEMFSQPIQTSLVVTQGEDGTWLICSPLISASASPGASEAPASSPAA